MTAATVREFTDAARERVDMCIDAAFYAGSSETEIINALSGANRILKSFGMTLAEYHRQSLERAHAPITFDDQIKLTSRELIKLAALQQEVGSLRTENAHLQARIGALEEQNAKLVSSASKVVATGPTVDVLPDGCIPYETFLAALYARIRTTKNAINTYSRETGTSVATVQRWRRAGKVPPEAFACIATLDPNSGASFQRKTVTGDHRARIDHYARMGLKDAEIAARMNEEFSDREFNVSIVAAAKNQSRHAFFTRMHMEGKTREQAASIFLKTYPRAIKLDATLDAIFGPE